MRFDIYREKEEKQRGACCRAQEQSLYFTRHLRKKQHFSPKMFTLYMQQAGKTAQRRGI
jgi:hypothetical protein